MTNLNFSHILLLLLLLTIFLAANLGRFQSPKRLQAFFHLHCVHQRSFFSIPYCLRHFLFSPRGRRFGDNGERWITEAVADVNVADALAGALCDKFNTSGWCMWWLWFGWFKLLVMPILPLRTFPLPFSEFGIVPNAMCTLCWAAAIALVYVGDGYGAYDVDGRGDNRTCFCGDIYVCVCVSNIFFFYFQNGKKYSWISKSFM